jgi:hypothetical protein
VQLSLNFLDRLAAEHRVWEKVSDRERAVIIEVLARILLKAALAPPAQEVANE